MRCCTTWSAVRFGRAGSDCAQAAAAYTHTASANAGRNMLELLPRHNLRFWVIPLCRPVTCIGSPLRLTVDAGPRSLVASLSRKPLLAAISGGSVLSDRL